MSMNFADAAQKKVEEIERPPLAPVGNYIWAITKQPTVQKSRNEQWEILNVPVRALEAVDADMEDYKGDVRNIVSTVRFMFNLEDEAEFERTLFRARQFFEKHVQCCEEGETLLQAMNKCVNGQFMGYISWSSDKDDPEVKYANLTKTAPVE